MNTSEKTDKIIPALFAAKRKFRSPRKDAINPQQHNEYSSLTANLDAIEPALFEEQLLLMQHPRLIALEREGVQIAYQLSVLTRVWHVPSGQWIEIEVQTLPSGRRRKLPDGTMETMPVTDQELGSSITYNRRYSLRSLFSLADRDDDGSASAEPINDKQIGMLDQLMADTGADYKKFCAYYQVASLNELPSDVYEDAVAMLQRKKITPAQEKELAEAIEKAEVDPNDFCVRHNIELYKELRAVDFKKVMKDLSR